MISRLILFLVLNFAALGIGGYLSGSGAASEWYADLNKAPWTPPGWVFGVAWTSIMICFSIYMAYLWPLLESKKQLIVLFSLQWILNVAWNPAFFYYHNPLIGMILITTLTLLLSFMFFSYYSNMQLRSIFLAPYVLWLLIACSLNAYILINN